MRKIKFRALDKKLPRRGLFAVDSIVVLGGGNGRYEIMQYTGLKDKNGKEIYEGDIVYWKPVDWVTNPKTITGEVFWDNSSLAFHVLFSDNDYSCKRWDFLGNHYEVIGNIYENPELLTYSQKA